MSKNLVGMARRRIYQNRRTDRSVITFAAIKAFYYTLYAARRRINNNEILLRRALLLRLYRTTVALQH
jgi:lysine/ornithine N-monooxygenase